MREDESVSPEADVADAPERPATRLCVSFFKSVKDPSGHVEQLTAEDLAGLFTHPRKFEEKGDLPLFSLVAFRGGRKDEHIAELYGIVAEHDAGEVSLDEAIARARVAGVALIGYTTPSHTPEHPRWRVVALFSRPRKPGEFRRCMDRLNGALGGILAPESWTRARIWYFGAVAGSGYQCLRTDGYPIDFESLDLDITSIPQPAAVERAEVQARDVIARASGEPGDRGRLAALARVNEKTLADLRSALTCLDPDSRDIWTDVGQNLSCLEERGRALWLEWSARSPKFRDGKDDPDRIWGSFTGDRSDYRAVFTKAQAAGWVNPGSAPVREDIAIVDGAAISMSEDNLALVFAHHNSDRLRYDHTRGLWLSWNGRRWRIDRTRLVSEFIRRLVRNLNKDGKARWAKASVYAAVEKIAQADPAFAVTHDMLDVDPWLLGTPDGVVDLRTGALLPPDPALMVTRAAAVVPAGVGAVPVKWLRFLQEATAGDAEVIRFLQRLVGYALTGTVDEHVLPFIFGAGGNGKGVFLNTVKWIFGEYAQAADMRLFTASKYERHATELAALAGARLVVASETERGQAWAEARIKALTGGDPVRARFMRQDEFEFLPTWQLLLVGNHRPKLQTVDDAMRRRMAMIEFPHRPKRVNKNLQEELKAEGPAILRWAIDGCLDWQREGLPRPASVQLATETYLSEQDDFGNWLKENCEMSLRAAEPASLLFMDWEQYARGAKAEAGNLKSFAAEMERRGFQKRKTKTSNQYIGIRLAGSFAETEAE